MNTDRVPPLVWYNRQHWVRKRDHPKPNPHSTTLGCLKLASPTESHNWPSLLRMDWTGTNWFMQPQGPWSHPIASSPNLIPRLIRGRREVAHQDKLIQVLPPPPPPPHEIANEAKAVLVYSHNHGLVVHFMVSHQMFDLEYSGYDLVQLIMVYHDYACGVLNGSGTICWERLGRAHLIAQLVRLAPPTSGGHNKSTRGNNRPITHTRNRPSDFHSQPSS